jgi:polyhydroxyalkanoate synthase
MIARLAAVARRAMRPLPRVGQTPADVVFTENKWRLLRYRPRAAGVAYKTPILMVPSLINRNYVLDLLPGKSLVEWLVERGHDVYMIDWGTPGAEDRYLTFDDVCDRYLGHAIARTARGSARGRVHLLGYCLGGTLAAAHVAASTKPERIASLVALAAPVRFEDGGLLERWTRSPGFDPDVVVRACGNVPWQLMQASFHMLRPTLTLAKIVHALDRAEEEEFWDGFLALETWGNDNVSFPGECWRRYIQELYRDDALARGTFTLSGRPADLRAIRCPTMAVTFEHDSIVPWRSASVLLEKIGSVDKDHVHLAGGHVGAVVAKSAAKKLWPTLAAWWAARDRGLAETPQRDAVLPS